MKKRIVLLVAVVCAAFLLVSCNKNAEPTVTPPETEQTEVPATPDDTMSYDALVKELSGLWNKIDGSTATIPLTATLHDAFGGAGNPPTHYTTPNAYTNLFLGTADLIFVTHPSENELAEAQNRGIELEIIPIVKDALVFLVNVENPVDGVSLKQLKDIYTGDITSWKQLGGLDETIVPYQRTQNSGSQTLMLKLLMDGMEPMNPPAEWVAAAMGDLVEVISGYDNARDAVGYSMFYYVNNMYGNSQFKLLGVDGVKPSRDTITRGEYPLEDYYYAVIRKDTPADSPARHLIDWLLTDEGQTLAARAGYIPLRPLENVFPDEMIDPVYLGDVDNSSGTGGTVPKPLDAIDDIVAGGVRKPLSDIFYDGFNYIQYINSEIISEMNFSKTNFDDYEVVSSAQDREIRPFTGIPNDYQNYEVVDVGNRYIQITLPESNPFFDGMMSFDIRLTSDISPYGTGMPDSYSVTYLYGGRMMSNVDLFTLKVKLPQVPEVAKRINNQLETWTDAFPGDEAKEKLLRSFVTWYTSDWENVSPEFAYRLQPFHGQWENYLSVGYSLQTYDGPSSNMPTLYAICFDMDTGKTVNLIEHLPHDIPYENSMTFDAITKFEAGTYPEQAFYEGYTPAEGSVITSAWLWGDSLGMQVAEPDGRKLQLGIYNWK